MLTSILPTNRTFGELPLNIPNTAPAPKPIRPPVVPAAEVVFKTLPEVALPAAVPMAFPAALLLTTCQETISLRLHFRTQVFHQLRVLNPGKGNLSLGARFIGYRNVSAVALTAKENP